MASTETQNTAVSFQPTCATLVPITIVLPTINNTPQKFLTSPQLPVWACCDLGQVTGGLVIEEAKIELI
jgi:hypothetical protein